MLHLDIDFAQNTAQHANGFVVGGEQKALESGFHRGARLHLLKMLAQPLT
jgi:hypothetical protein